MFIVHASDLHLGRPLRDLSVHPKLEPSCFSAASERALTRLVDLCLSSRAELLLIAGDLLDFWQRNYQLGLRLIAELSRLEHLGTRVFWVRGNHDAENRVIRNLLLPAHVRELGLGGAQTLHLPELDVRLTGASYETRQMQTNLFADFPEADPSLTCLGMLHTSAEGEHSGDSYAPCGKRELTQKGYQYLALGHVHEPVVVSSKPPVAYSGCLQGRHFGESGPRGCRLVELQSGQVRSMEHLSLEVVRFGRIEVDIGDCADIEQVLETIHLQVQETLGRLESRALAVRVVLQGQLGLSVLWQLPLRARSQHLHQLLRFGCERLSIDGFWAKPSEPTSPTLRLDDESELTRRDL